MDLGTTSVQVAVRGRGIVLEEPSVVAVERRTGKILEVGQAARQMLGRTPGELVAVRPLEQGYIADCTMAEEMVSAFLRKALPRRLFKPRLLLCVPSGSAEVAERAVVEAGVRAGARKVYLMEEPLAAALGAGIDIRQPQGHMVVDIGGGTTDVAVTALGGVVASACLAFRRVLFRSTRPSSSMSASTTTCSSGHARPKRSRRPSDKLPGKARRAPP